MAIKATIQAEGLAVCWFEGVFNTMPQSDRVMLKEIVKL